ncbi:MAG: hypothetical protein JXB04_07520 [Kiritimatiellae bacterium]|nr:hypothetical protein [Kiritimatiellia bacterium]
MRRPRLKPDDQPLFYHLYNRVAGEPAFLPFDSREKEHFIRLLHRLNLFFSVKVVAYQVMSNHFHLLVHVPQEPPAPNETCRRYKAYYHGLRTLDPASPRCQEIARRMRDISWYMQTLQQQFTRWYNRTRPTRRRGGLWADRFKHTLLGNARAVWECWKYIEMNPVRAHMVAHPADYRFSSFGAWSGQGSHPFRDNLRQALLPCLADIYPFESEVQLYATLQDVFADIQGVPTEPDGKVSRFTVHLDRRVRYWVDGLVIGSELFVQDMVLRSRGILRRRARGFTRARSPDADAHSLPLCCYKQLRAI